MQVHDQVAVLELGAHRDQVLDAARVPLEAAHVRDRRVRAHDVGVFLLGPELEPGAGEGPRQRVRHGQGQDDVAERGEPQHGDAAEAAGRGRPRASRQPANWRS